MDAAGTTMNHSGTACEKRTAAIVELAKAIAEKAHQGQTRRDRQTPYIVHPADVAARVKTDVEKAVAWLHDVLEDTFVTAAEMTDLGVPLEVVEAVQVLTRGRDETYEAFISRVAMSPLATTVKRADIASNLADAPTDKQKKKYAAALAVLGAVPGAHAGAGAGAVAHEGACDCA